MKQGRGLKKLCERKEFTVYDSTLGRWLQQEPLGNPGVERIEPATLLLSTYSPPNLATAVNADSNPSTKYTDGLNVYQAVHDNPLSRVDAQGLSGATTQQATPLEGGDIIAIPGLVTIDRLAFRCEDTMVVAIGNVGGQIGATIGEGASFIFHDLWLGRGGRGNLWWTVQKSCNECYIEIWASPLITPFNQPKRPTTGPVAQ
jgi:hypothetical protein